MKRSAFAGAIAGLLFVATAVLASDSYTNPWTVVPSSGGIIAGGFYVLGYSVGQPATGYAAGGEFILTDGFWADAPGYSVYLPLLLTP